MSMANSIHCSNKYFLITLILLQILTEISAKYSNNNNEDFDLYYCGTASAKAGKTCISVRLPWQRDPIYFCTKNENIKYRSNCGHNHHQFCGENARSDDLLIATPWDCCPLISTPDYCVTTTCPPQPYNRTCTTTNHTFTSHQSSFVGFGRLHDECCPNYFCDVGVQPEDCENKRLEAECMPPPNKTNCIAFRDQHGCCEKYQCDEDDKKFGFCPPNPFAGHSPTVSISGDEYMGSTVSSANGADSNSNTDASMTTEKSEAGSWAKREINSRTIYNKRKSAYGDMRNLQQCMGDYNCPGEEKCCPTGHGFEINQKTTLRSYEGYCKHPLTNHDL